MPIPVRRGLLPVVLLVLAGVAMPACAGPGTATATDPEMVDCAVVLNMPLIQQAAREWQAPAGGMTAVVLVHEQEHCLRVPDDRETPAVAAEQRLAKKLRNPRLVAFVEATLTRLDASGYWKS